jgi:hypothetical protein
MWKLQIWLSWAYRYVSQLAVDQFEKFKKLEYVELHDISPEIGFKHLDGYPGRPGWSKVNPNA